LHKKNTEVLNIFKIMTLKLTAMI